MAVSSLLHGYDEFAVVKAWSIGRLRSGQRTALERDREVS